MKVDGVIVAVAHDEFKDFLLAQVFFYKKKKCCVNLVESRGFKD